MSILRSIAGTQIAAEVVSRDAAIASAILGLKPQPIAESNAVYHQPTGPIVTSSAQPFGVTLVTPASCLLDATFAPGGTCPDRATLDSLFYYRNNEGSLDSPTTYPNQGASANWEAVYRQYPAVLSDGTTLDPRDLHVLNPAGYLELIARTRLPGDFGTDRFQMGYLRAPVHMRPGNYVEACVQAPSHQASWWTMWGFSNEQVFGTKNVYYAHPSLELDCVDGFPEDTIYPGASITQGVPLYSYSGVTDADYGPPSDTYIANGPTYTGKYGGQDGGAGVNRMATIPASDPTLGFHTYAIDWRDANTIIFLYDGIIVRVRHVVYTGRYDATYVAGDYSKSNGAPSIASALYGTFVGSRIEVSHQFGCKFNPQDLAALNANNDATNPIRASYKVKWLRVWNSVSTAQPPTSTASAGALGAPQTGSALGDLPAITTGTYVLNIDASQTGATRDLVGGNVVRLIGGAQLGSETINGLATVLLQPNSVYPYSSGIGVTGQAVARAQGTGQVILFVVMYNRNPYGGDPQTLAQWVRATPKTGVDSDKLTLMMTAYGAGGSTADFDTHGTNYGGFLWPSSGALASAQIGGCNFGGSELVSISKTLAGDGTVVVGTGYSQEHMAPGTTGAPPPAGYTELVLGCGRDQDGLPTRGANVRFGQAVLVALPTGGSLSSADRAAIETYLQAKWATRTVAAVADVANLGPQPDFSVSTPATTLNGANYYWINKGGASVSGGGTNPVVLTSPTNPNVEAFRALVTPMGLGTYDAKVTMTVPATNYYNGGLILATANQSHFVAVLHVMVNGNTDNFEVDFEPDTHSGKTTTFASSLTIPGVGLGAPYYLRTVNDGTNITLLGSLTGAAAGWTVLTTQTVAACGSPTHVGVFMNANDQTSNGTAGVITLTRMGHTTATDPQAVAS